ncbi:MAG: hypothetical protein V4717_23370 [Bacteroidota bacterium]
MKRMLLFTTCILAFFASFAQPPIMKPKPTVKAAGGKKQVFVEGKTSIYNPGTEETYFLEIINQKDMEIVSRNSAMMRMDNDKNNMEADCRQAFQFIKVLHALSCNNLPVLEQAYADSNDTRTIETLNADGGVLRSARLVLYQNQFYNQLTTALSMLRSCTPALENLFANGTIQVVESSFKRGTTSPNQIILPVFPQLNIGSPASMQYMEYIESLLSRYTVPQEVFAAYKTKERQNIPDGNEEQLTKARKLFILYLHAKFKNK